MNAAHLHLIVNHLPVIGVMFGLAFYLVAMIKGKDIPIKAAFWIFFSVALLAIPAYLTGEPAREYIDDDSGIPRDIIQEHEETAEVAFVATLVLGLLSLMGLINYRRRRHLSKLFLTFMLLVAVVVAALMASAANQGGEIRHPEIRPGSASPTDIAVEPDTAKPPPADTRQESEDDNH